MIDRPRRTTARRQPPDSDNKVGERALAGASSYSNPPATPPPAAMMEDDGVQADVDAHDIEANTGQRRSSRRTPGANGETATAKKKRVARKVRDVDAARTTRTRLKGLIQAAQYEIDVDPYRGVLSLFAGRESGSHVSNPWAACCFSLTAGERGASPARGGGELDEGAIVVALDRNCCTGCPSLLSWTEDATRSNQREKPRNGRKKRKQKKSQDDGGRGGNRASDNNGSDVKGGDQPETVIGKRNTDPNFRCPCDYNPLCLASLGGAIDDCLLRLAKTRSDDCDLNGYDSAVIMGSMQEGVVDPVLADGKVVDVALTKEIAPNAMCLQNRPVAGEEDNNVAHMLGADVSGGKEIATASEASANEVSGDRGARSDDLRPPLPSENHGKVVEIPTIHVDDCEKAGGTNTSSDVPTSGVGSNDVVMADLFPNDGHDRSSTDNALDKRNSNDIINLTASACLSGNSLTEIRVIPHDGSAESLASASATTELEGTDEATTKGTPDNAKDKTYRNGLYEDADDKEDATSILHHKQCDAQCLGESARHPPSNDEVETTSNGANLSSDMAKAYRPSVIYYEDFDYGSGHFNEKGESDVVAQDSVASDDFVQLRKAVSVDDTGIRLYAKENVISCHSAIPSRSNAVMMTVDQYISKIRVWHKSLLYCHLLFNPPSAQQEGPKAITLSIPPGMRNLGATCYLNSQMQCLAQNPAFIRGVFSWRKSENSCHSEQQQRMNRVLSSMQTLIARMVYGPDRTVCTDDFSTALGLGNDEMQDPNEFGRLLFERMHESFQKCLPATQDTAADLGRKERGLHDLLPSIFRGIIKYVTTCLHCSSSSERNEDFMDLTLPIKDPNESLKADRNKMNADREDGIPKVGNDSDVQVCLNRYLHPEYLDKENQYWCEKCGRKQDAERSVTFEQLPPVLNIQLARYVFDRKMHMKKKLVSKVLLPRSLLIPNGESKRKHLKRSASKEHDNKEYILCAVLNHLGPSAYGGHYVAEAMDWSTGTWYEFNDEDVILLPDGPSCSFVPRNYSNGENRRNSKRPKGKSTGRGKVARSDNGIKGATLRGSEDAYNMFYVEKSYLALCAQEQVICHDELRANPPTNKDSFLSADVLEKVTKERNERYSLVTEMHMESQKRTHRMRRRRIGILRSMFPLARSASFANSHDKHGPPNVSEDTRQRHCLAPLILGLEQGTSPVWVDGETLRKFLSCTNDMDKILSSDPNTPLLQHRQFLCPHGVGLHPKVARRGKFLPRESYNAYLALLLGERNLLRGKSGDNEKVRHSDINDCIITPTSNFVCNKCAKSYQEELTQAVNNMNLIMELFDDLDGTVNDIDPKEAPEDEDVIFALSRSFVSCFKAKASKLMKAASNAMSASACGKDSESVVSRSCVDGGLMAGLDMLDFSDILPEPHGSLSGHQEGCTGSSEIEKDDQIGDNLDRFVNSKITCEHGNCNMMNNRRSVRYVPESVWEKISQLFPEAIRHQRIRTCNGDDESNKFDGSCSQCKHEKNEKVMVIERLKEWAAKCMSRSNGVLCDFYLRGETGSRRQYPSDLFTTGCPQSDVKKLHLVHQSDTSTLRKAKGLAQILHGKQRSRSKSTDDDIQDQLYRLFYRDKDDTTVQADDCGVAECESPRSANAPWGHTLRSLLCDKHKLAVSTQEVVRILLSEKDGKVDDANKLPLHVEVMNETEYSAYVSSLLEIDRIFHPSEHESAEENNHTCLLKLLSKECHPTVTVTADSDGGLCVTEVQPATCDAGPCVDEFERRCATAFVEEDSPDDGGNSSVEKKRHKNNGVEMVNGNRNLSGDATTVESSPEMFTVRVHEVEYDANLDEMASVLLSEPPSSAEVDTGALRRSKRKRKTRSQGNPNTYEVTVSPNHNLANLRLLLFTDFHLTPVDQELILVVCQQQKSDHEVGSSPNHGSETISPSQATPTLVPLPFDWNTRLVHAILETDCNGVTGAVVPVSNQYALGSVVNIYLRYSDSKTENGGKKQKSQLSNREKKAERERLESALIDSLMETANFASRVGDQVDSDAAAHGSLLTADQSSNDSQNSSSHRRRSGRRGGERGFRGTFLQSMSSSTPSGATSIDGPADVAPNRSPQSLGVDGDRILDSCLDRKHRSPQKILASHANRDSPIIIDDDTLGEVNPKGSDNRKRNSSQIGESNCLSREQAIGGCTGKSLRSFCKFDLSPLAMSRTRPAYPEVTNIMTGGNADFTPCPSQPKLPKLGSELETLTREIVANFISDAKARFFKPSSNDSSSDPNLSQSFSPSVSDLGSFLPEYSADDHARHLYRNFVDSPDPIGGPRQLEDNLYISRREMDIFLYHCNIKSEVGDECHEFMPYRRIDGVRNLYRDVRKRTYCSVTESYMKHVNESVGLIVDLERMTNEEKPSLQEMHPISKEIQL